MADNQIINAQGQTPLPHACTECKRRKQKCDRQWPCNQCTKRKVVDQCRFGHDEPSPGEVSQASTEGKRKLETGTGSSGDEEELEANEVLGAIGYSRGHILTKLDQETRTTRAPDQYRLDPSTSAHLKRALDVLPPRHMVDSLIQNFLNVVNFYYYIIYPPNFSKEYTRWWKDYDAGRPLGVQWTCLLLMVCACSVQHVDDELSNHIESKLGVTVKELTNQYHDAARELHGAIPLGNGHIFSVQYLLHSCYWFKAEARFAECWQVLGAVVREAQMIDLHKKPVGQLPGFELEMKQRLWCIVDSWDWLVSSLLARPMLVDRAEPDIGLPSLTFEDYPVSPMLHLKLQAELVGLIFQRFGPPKILTDPNDIEDYRTIMEDFMQTFPPEYAFKDPDTSSEDRYPWIALHRHYQHTCTLAIALGPFRGFMAKTMTKDTPAVEIKFRQHGIKYALDLMDAVHRFFEYVWTRDTTFHFVPFCIFDTAALLCSVILHDADSSIPKREEITDAIARAFATLKRLRTATNTAKAPYDVLRRLIKKMPVSIKVATPDGHKKRRFDPPPPPSSGSASVRNSSLDSGSTAPPQIQEPVSIPVQPMENVHIADTSYPPTTSGPNDAHLKHAQQAYTVNDPSAQQAFHGYGTVPQQHVSPHSIPTTSSWPDEAATQGYAEPPVEGLGFQNISDAELGDLAMLWNWESLDLGFTENPIYSQEINFNESGFSL